MNAKKTGKSRSAMTRDLKRRIQATIDRHRSMAFNEVLELVVKENPRSRAFGEWFDHAWAESIKPGAG